MKWIRHTASLAACVAWMYAIWGTRAASPLFQALALSLCGLTAMALAFRDFAITIGRGDPLPDVDLVEWSLPAWMVGWVAAAMLGAIAYREGLSLPAALVECVTVGMAAGAFAQSIRRYIRLCGDERAARARSASRTDGTISED